DRWAGLVLEGLAVLVGVLLAFGVESYGIQRQDRAAEAAYLAALELELGVNAEIVDDGLATTEERIEEASRYLLEVVHAPDEGRVGATEVNQMLRDVAPFRVTSYQRGALDDLLASGGLELVRSEDTRRAILVYSRVLEQEGIRQQAALEFWERQMSPYYYEHASFYDFLGWAERGGRPLPDALDIGAFAGARAYSNLLIERRVRDTNLRRAREALAAQIVSVMTLLDGP
ncbi:MAG: hypothetical protein KJO44_03625, partial [Gemmatimonadetes bacterium]|nr:hypothetical protein [Gemmatimonadota bacterium]